MPECELIACFELSRPHFGEHKFDKIWELENGKKIRVSAFQKVAKTGNIGEKSKVAGYIDYVRYLSMQKVNDCFTG